MAEKYLIGGQAVIEGVMMRNKDKIAISVRAPNKDILTKKLKIKFPHTEIPFLRGIVNLFEMLYIGIKSLDFSSSIFTGKEEKSSPLIIFLTIILSIALAVLLFKFIPLGAAQLLSKHIEVSNISFNLIEGIVKLFILLGYIYCISFIPDIKRTFQYHGAEHKAVNCYESGLKLTVKNVKKFSTKHPRCGTTFIILIILISIIFYTFIPKGYSFFTKFILRLLLLPVIASFSYELLKMGGKYRNNFFIKFLLEPGLLVQKLTTKEPDNKQIEVGIASLKAVL